MQENEISHQHSKSSNLVPWAFLRRGGDRREISPENEVGIGAPYPRAPVYYSLYVSRVIL